MINFIRNVVLLFALMAVAVNMDAKACDYPEKTKAGEMVKCDGVMLSNEQFIEASNNKKTIRLQELKIAQYEGLEELYEYRHSHMKDELRSAKNELKWLQIKSTAGYVISFSLGAIITGYIAKEVLK